MILFAVKKSLKKSTGRDIEAVMALFIYRPDAYEYIKEQMIESMPSALLDYNKSKTLEIENDFYVEPLEVKIGEEK